MDNFPFPFLCWNGSFCVKELLCGRNAESVYTSFLVASITRNMDCTSLMDASIGLFFVSLSSF